MATAQQLQLGRQALDDLEQERNGSWMQIASTWDASGGQARDAALSYFANTVPAALQALARRLDTLDGDSAWSRWVIDCEQLHKDMSDVLGYVSDWAWTSVLLKAGSAAGGELADKAKTGVTVGAGLVGALVLGYVAWKVLS